MSTIYSGDGTIPTSSYARKAIVSSTWTAPIVLTVTAHGLTTGDFVEVAGHTLNLTANGRWTVAVIDANTFTLVGSLLGGSAGGADGYVISYAVHPLITIPSDGVDARNAASVNVPAEAAQDKIAYLYERAGSKRLYDVREVATTDNALAAWSSNGAGIFDVAAWNVLANGTMFAWAAPAPVVNDLDILEIWATLTAQTTANGAPVSIGLGLALDLGGPYNHIAGSGIALSGAVGSWAQLALHGYATITGGTNNRLWNVAIMGYGNGGGTTAVSLLGHRQVTVHHLRSN